MAFQPHWLLVNGDTDLFRQFQSQGKLCKFFCLVSILSRGDAVGKFCVRFVEVAVGDGGVVFVVEWGCLVDAMKQEGMFCMYPKSCQYDRDGQAGCFGDQAGDT